MIGFKKDIENFVNSDMKEAIVLNIISKEKLSPLKDRFNTTRANINMVKNNFLDYIYKNHQEIFDEYFNIDEKKTMSINFFERKYHNIVKDVLRRIFKKRKRKVIISRAAISESFYIEAIATIKNSELPIVIDELSKHLKCNANNIDDVLYFYSTENTIYYDNMHIYSFKAGAFKIVDSVAEVVSAELPELYSHIKTIATPLPKVINSYDKFIKLVNARIISKKGKNDELHNFLRIGKGNESIVTRKRAFEIFKLDESKANQIIEACYVIAQKMECNIDTEFLLSKLKEEGDVLTQFILNDEINPYFLKSLLVKSGVFIQGRKFNVALKDKGCDFKTIIEMIEMLFEKTEKKTMSAKAIELGLKENGRYVQKNNLHNVLLKNFKQVQVSPPVFSKDKL